MEILGRLAAALACGAVVGLNREAYRKPAGLRTNMLVALGACAFTLLTVALYAEVVGAGGRSDPVRIIEAVVGGIGFLGAATVIRGRRGVEGVTTAAAIWVVGALGVACGLGSLKVALMTTLLALLTLWGLGLIERGVSGSEIEA